VLPVFLCSRNRDLAKDEMYEAPPWTLVSGARARVAVFVTGPCFLDENVERDFESYEGYETVACSE